MTSPLPTGCVKIFTGGLVASAEDAAAVSAGNPLWVRHQEPLAVVEVPGPSISTRTSPTVTNVVTTVLASNPARRGATFFHDGTGNCFLALGLACTPTDFTWRMVANDYFELPFGYTGTVTAIRASGSNVLRVTELT